MTGANKGRGNLKPKDRIWVYLVFIVMGLIVLFFLFMGGRLMTDIVS